MQGSALGERWFHGIFFGKKAGSEENIVMRENGSVVRARAIRELQKILTLNFARCYARCWKTFGSTW